MSSNQTGKNICCCSLKRQHTKWFTLLQNIPGECAPDTIHVRANVSYICHCTVNTHRVLTLERSFSGTYSAKHLFLSLRERIHYARSSDSSVPISHLLHTNSLSKHSLISPLSAVPFFPSFINYLVSHSIFQILW